MKKFALAAAIALLAGAAFAQDQGANPPPPAGSNPQGPRIEWKIGTVVTTEYKKVTGTITLADKGPDKFTVDGVEYELRAPRHELSTLKTGDSLTVEGTFTTVKSDTKVPALARAFKLTINGKEIDVRRGPHPMGGNGPKGPGPQGGDGAEDDGAGPQ